jgi:peptidyl-tRNA hydrolase, PTH1 family
LSSFDWLKRFLGRESGRGTSDEPMKLIVGLGNPGKEYVDTRHNVGWWVIDHLAGVWRFEGWRKDQNSLVSDGRVDNQRVRLVKPQTYMNLSGGILRPYLRRETWVYPTA